MKNFTLPFIFFQFNINPINHGKFQLTFIIILLLLYSTLGYGQGSTFGDFTEVTPPDSLFVTPLDEDFWVITTAPADFDGDGDVDIAVLGYYVIYNQDVEFKLVLISNEGASGQIGWDFKYINIPLTNLSVGSSDMAWGDFDTDGDPDLVVGSDGRTVLYINNSGKLELVNTDLPAYWEDNDQAYFDLRSITWGDYDNDGDVDLFLPSIFDESSFTYRTVLMRNDGSDSSRGWIFTETDPGFPSTSHGQSSWADYDGDFDLDLLLVNIAPLYEDGFIRIYRNEGNAGFIREDILGSVSIEHGEVQWGDYDGDGDLDILLAGNIKELDSTYTPLALRIYRNDAGNYTPFEVIECPECEGWFDFTAATWADYDTDGDIDILLAGSYNSGNQIEGRAMVYTNDGNGVFTDLGNQLPAPMASGSRGGTFSWFDIDGDGDLDYFIAGEYFVPDGNGLVEAQMHVYRNDSEGNNNAPASPEGLNAFVDYNSVRLTWNPAADDHTPTPQLTYDLLVIRKGTHRPRKTSDSLNSTEDVVLTRLPEPGNISANNEWLLNGLPDGYYTWEIRAVDAAYIGSPFSTGEFNIGVLSSISANRSSISFELKQNYPNPFNAVTKIKFTVPHENVVKVKVYDILGKEIQTLLNEYKQAGTYEVEVDANDLQSGVYFYRMISGNYTGTKKMILLR